MSPVTMKQARRACPCHEQVRQRDEDIEGRVRDVLVRPRTPIAPFRSWARESYAKHDAASLSPKLRHVVFGGPRRAS